MKTKLKFIDLFAGLGGIRLGFEQACKERGIETECVLTSEIKPYAIETLRHNHHHENFVGDIFSTFLASAASCDAMVQIVLVQVNWTLKFLGYFCFVNDQQMTRQNNKKRSCGDLNPDR